MKELIIHGLLGTLVNREFLKRPLVGDCNGVGKTRYRDVSGIQECGWLAFFSTVSAGKRKKKVLARGKD